MRWNNKAVQRQIKSLGLGDIERQPKPIEVNLNNDLHEIEQSQSFEPKENDESTGYQNPFARVDPFAKNVLTDPKPEPETALEGGPNHENKGHIRRKWRVEVDEQAVRNIESGRSAWDRYLKQHNNTSNKDVWKVYDHLTADLFNDILGELMTNIDKDLDNFCEKFIVDEFQMQ